ncbi:hypothetical protein [Treponema pedis]|uniref:hypothetical protein n=1 Tax=Treponema pedis TaxID=409322 RepID=UPI000427CD7B|nr:hypothetical protein [Treponema pedis]QSI05663.1 hypothetical protein DYQ05_12485 [Treponema pedis]
MKNFKMQKATPELVDKLIKPVTSITGEHREGFLVTAGSGTEREKWNTMTAGWGGIGYLWNKITACVVIRPTRYTYEFAEREDYITLSFFDSKDKKMREALSICGTKSGRDIDKAEVTGLKPVLLEEGAVGFEQAKINIVCRKLYRSRFDPDLFSDPQIIINAYPKRDFHYVYICEILSIYTKE